MYKKKDIFIKSRNVPLILSPITLMVVALLHIPLNAEILSIYGQGHVSADSVNDGKNNTLQIASNSSRLGVKGQKSLNNGINVIYQYETGVDLTGQGDNDGNGSSEVHAGQVFTRGRPSFIGLNGSFGQVLLGHTPGLDQWANDQNYFADQIGDLGNFWENGVVGGRLDNVIQYTTPKKNGLEGVISYVPDEDDTNEDVLILKLNVVSNQMKLSLTYAIAGTNTETENNKDASIFALTAGYDFGVLTLGAGYQLASDISGVSGNNRDDFSLSVGLPISSAGRVKAQFASSLGESNNTDATMYAIGYDHKLSDNTSVYVAYAATDNDSNVNFSVNGKGHGDAIVPAIGEDPSAFSFGIVSSFDLSLR